jgi:hypothetical protein
MSCKKAIGVARQMKEKFGAALELNIFRMDSQEAGSYRFLGSTNVLFNKESVPLEIAIDNIRMDQFLSSRLTTDNVAT